MFKTLLIAILTLIISTVNAEDVSEPLKENPIDKKEQNLGEVVNILPSKKIEEIIPEDKSLSPKTRKILSEIYNHQKRHARVINKKISIDRTTKSGINISGYEIIEGDSKFDIQVKKMGPKLEKKYNLYKKAYNSLNNGQTEASIVLYKALLDKYHNDELAMIGLAQAYHQLGDFETARDLYAKALAIYPHNREAINNFLILISNESPNEALNEFLRLEQVFADSHILKAQIASLYSIKGKYSEALHFIQAALKLDSGNPKYIYNKAVILDNLGLNNEAKDIYQKILISGAYNVIGVSIENIKNRINNLGV